MGWEKYDPFRPPKEGQRIRCASQGEVKVSKYGLIGTRLLQGRSWDDLANKDWEVFWEDEPCPPTLPEAKPKVPSDREQELAFFRGIQSDECPCKIKREVCIYHRNFPIA